MTALFKKGLKWHSVIMLATVFLFSLMAQPVQAANGEYDDPSKAFSWYSKGPGVIHLKIKLCDDSGRRTFHQAKFGVSIDGKDINCIYVEESSSGAKEYIRGHFGNFLTNESLLFITNDNQWKPLCWISGTSDQHDVVRETPKEYGDGYVEFDWYYPVRFAGKKATFYVHDAKLWDLEKNEYTVYNKDIGTMEFDEISFETYDVMPSTEAADAATIQIPFTSDRPINYVDATYTDEDGILQSIPRIKMDKNTYFGFVKLPATEKVSNLTIMANVRSVTIEKSNLPQSSWPSILDGDIVKTIDKIPVIHNPRLLKADVDSVGAVVLQWKISDTDSEDLLEGDIFQIQRSLTGKMEDFEDLESDVVFDSKTEEYTFRDSTLMSTLSASQIDKNLGIPLVRYRVFRATTQELWGMEKNPTVAYVQPQFATLTLMEPTNATVAWSDEEEHTVKVRWDWKENDASHNYVWDERAVMKVEINMFDRNEKLIDSHVTTLTESQFRSREAELTLNRSCVTYQMSLIVDGSKSPIGNGSAEIFRLIKNIDDFNNYTSALWAKGRGSLIKAIPNAILATNITLNNDNNANHYLGYTYGTNASDPFTGNFNGNGYKLTVIFPKTNNMDAVAPILHIANGAVICNLTTVGSFTANNKYTGGIVGQADEGTVFIENCYSTFSISSLYDGDGEHGGVIGLVKSSANIHITNTLFGGSITSPSYIFTSGCGGFVGLRESGSFAMIRNSYFRPAGLNVNYDGAAVFMRNQDNDGIYGLVEGSMYKTIMGTAQGKQSDTAPDNWCWKDEKPKVKQVEFSTPVSGSIIPITMPQDKLYYENLGHINKDSLTATTLHSSVFLTWENVDERSVDYYEVWRRDVLLQDSIRLATQLIDMQYEDKTTSPTHSYEYFVRGVNNCEGTTYEDTKWVKGNCVQTGQVSGYVRFPDGTGIPGVTVYISNEEDTYEVKTDESGYFMKNNLPYWNGGGESAYSILPKVSGYDGTRSISFGTTPGSNTVGGVEFLIEKSVKFSGFVMYTGTSIPVQGATFLVDGREIQTASGKVTSDHEGKFSFRVLPGMKHSIQAVKDGHVFYQNGFYHADSDTAKKEYEFNVDVANIYFYDDTRVTLIGRVAGGRTQGDIPLGNSLSRNNLGDDLKMVFVLEGDNASRLVFDITDRTKKERDEVFIHKAHDKKYVYQTSVHTTEHRMEVTPDVHTGEYMVKLPPVKWKIQQITARGYATLFQDGQTGDVIDLTDSITLHTDHFKGAWATAEKDSVRNVDVTYHAQYNRIYRSPVLLERRQIGFDKFEYFGEKNYTMRPLVGEKQQIPIAYPVTMTDPKTGKEIIKTEYTFGHPVFSTDRGYSIRLSALERYYYNNNENSDTVDVVKLDGGFVTIRNGLISGTKRDTLTLDSNGEGIYILRAAQLPYLITGNGALCTVTFTMLRDGVNYEGEPLKAYTFSQYTKPGAKDILSVNKPILVDILRDPPGSGSSAKLSKGSTLKLAYQMDMSWKAGLTLGVSVGAGVKNYTGIVASFVAEYGMINDASSLFNTNFDLIFSGSGQRAFSYTMTLNEDISTDGGSTMVGADADLYMGMETNMFLRPTVAVRAINDSVFRASGGALAAGYMVEIARGRDQNDSIFHLVRDEVIGYGQKVNSTFVHSQQYIIKQLIPNLAQQCKSLMFTGTQEQAKQQANATGSPVYLSLRDVNDENFGMLNTKKEYTDGDETWDYVYNTTIAEAKEGINYLIVLPDGYSGAQQDKVKDFCEAMYTWISMIARNEKEKLEATNKMKNFDVDGGGSVSYSEDFAAEYSNTSAYNWIFSDYTHNYFANPDPDNPDAYGHAERTEAALSSIAGILGPTAAKLVFSLLNNSKALKGGESYARVESNNRALSQFDINFVGYKWKFSLTPTLAYGVTPKNSEARKYNRKESFTIKMDKKSHLDFDVYYSSVIDSREETTVDGKTDIFVEENFLNSVDYVEYFIDRDVGANDIVHDMIKPRGFIYRTRGGATVRTWENERKTMFYRAGTVLDERTKKIENPVIKMDKQSISGVPIDEPARFKIYMTNESEQPEAIGGALQYYTLYLDGKKNPKGAKLTIDGLPLSTDGMTIKVLPGEVTEKTLEVWASEDFDYEDLIVGIISPGDVQCVDEVSFSVHYLRQAGSVEISTPGDKWIMNTDAPFDSIRGWYLPVIISNFNKNQYNFDHIEFQYKECTRGDDYWTNLCGFYADSTSYRNASGTKDMIPENGYIQTKFYGEGQVMEKAYDLRAVLFCRNGNSFLTNSSKVLSGIKDTRRPQLFGSPEPKDGILGAGENIIFNFSEPIEHNYLQVTTNFEVLGETNETAIQEEPSLLFGGKGYAQSEARRNFADRDITIEVMIKPSDTLQAMPIFSHGTDGKQLQLWLTKEKLLKVIVDGVEMTGDSVISTDSFSQVALVLDNSHKRISIIGENFVNTLDSVVYKGYGPLVFGSTNQADVHDRQFYKGRMLQARVWNRAMDALTLNMYGKKLLTGYEMGLIDYYPMNEGEGQYANDYAQGAHLTLKGSTWAQPRGMSLKIDYDEPGREVKGMKLRSERFSRTDEQDYTLMFWFKTDSKGRGALLSNGSGRATDTDARNKFFIGFEGDTLKYRTGGTEYVLGTTQSDDAWHHYAMTVNRSRQVANIYVDTKLKASFSTENLGGMAGDNFYLGNMVWFEAGPNDDVLHQYNPFTGYIDGICLFEQALPPTLIKRYCEKSVGGGEKGLITFAGFNRQERMLDNSFTLQPYGLSQKLYYDLDTGQETARADTLFCDSLQYVMDHIDHDIGAPMQAYQELRNLNFSFVGRDHQLLINLDELDSRINKRQVFVTVYDMPDMNGNYMASPATAEVFVDRNPLRWSQKSLKKEMYTDDYEEMFQLRIINESGAPHTYTIENLPKWLTTDVIQDVVDPKSEVYVDFTISKDINVGTYDYVIYLTDENGLSEPFALSLIVQGLQPDWYVPSNQKQFSMNIVARTQIKDDIVTDSRDIVGAFDSYGRCMGVANVNYNAETAESMVYMSVFNDMDTKTPLTFKLWHCETGRIMVLTPSESVEFGANHIVGSAKKPLILRAGNQYLQTLELQPGWNWISFNVYNNDFRNGVDKLLNPFKWQEGDLLADETNNVALIYKNNGWMIFGTDDIANIKLNVSNSYRVKVANTVNVEITGSNLTQQSQRTIKVKQGWNSIGYTPMVNLPIETALSDYLDQAKEGDIVKSKTEFVQFTVGANGSKEWKGNLRYMKPGEGYLLYRKDSTETSFMYPLYEPNVTFGSMLTGNKANVRSAATRYANTMSLTATVSDIDIMEGDRLLAISGAEIRGEVTFDGLDNSQPDPQMFYMSIEGDSDAPLSFAIERDGQIIATTANILDYKVNGISGNANDPTCINFIYIDLQESDNDAWYSLQGIRLQEKPVKAGLYIHNGRKQYVK